MADASSDLRLVVAYDGTEFRGWAAQRDPAIRTVEGLLSDALALITGERPSLSVAGRTDAGVHARGQVVSFPTPAIVDAGADRPGGERRCWGPRSWCATAATRRRASTPGSPRRRACTATGSTRARWRIRSGPGSCGTGRAGSRSRRCGRPPASWWGSTTSRRSAGSRAGGRSTIRRLQRLTVDREAERLELGFRANAFCHQMVRALVGDARGGGGGADRSRRHPGDRGGPGPVASAGQLAPARGLTLERVVYGRRL